MSADRLALLKRARAIYHEAYVGPQHVAEEVITDHLQDAIARPQQERDAAIREAEALREEVRRLREKLIPKKVPRPSFIVDPPDAEDEASAQSIADDVERARDDLVRIWSGEHNAYWRPNAQGYTIRAAAAWLLPRTEAESRTMHCGPEKMIEIQEASDIANARAQGIAQGIAQGRAEMREMAERTARGMIHYNSYAIAERIHILSVKET